MRSDVEFPERGTPCSQVASLREEVTAVVNSADAKRGDAVILRLISGGGSVTGYDLAPISHRQSGRAHARGASHVAPRARARRWP